jgi:hypothetical protein
MTPDFFYGEMLRWSFGFENPNKAAVIFACLVPLLWAAWLVAFRLRSSSWQIISLIGAAIGFLALWCCLLLTFSRGGLVAAVSGMSVVSSWVWFGMSNRAPGGWSVILCRRRFWLSVLLIGVVAAAAGMALSMGFKILDQYWKDPVALALAGAVLLALSLFHARLVPVVLISGPLAMVWYWPRQGRTSQ